MRARTAAVAQAEEQAGASSRRTQDWRVATGSEATAAQNGRREDRRAEGQAQSGRTPIASIRRFSDQIAADEMANSVLADEILEAMEKVDVLKAHVPEQRSRVAKAKDELAKAQQQVRAEEEIAQAETKRLEEELREAENALPDDFRELYQRVVKAKGQDAMAVIEDGSCGGCYQQLTANMVNEINMGRVVLCKSCGRVLYLPEDHAAGKELVDLDPFEHRLRMNNSIFMAFSQLPSTAQ